MTAPTTPARHAPTRSFAHFELRELLGRSAGTMVWLAFDKRAGAEVMLTLPRVAPADPAALELRLRAMRKAARLDHPQLAKAAEVGTHEHWPYIAVERAEGRTLREWLAEQPRLPPLEAAALAVQALAGLAYAHEAGAAHHDLQLHALLVDANARVKVMGFGVAAPDFLDVPADAAPTGAAPLEAAALHGLREHRDAAQRDVLALGLLLHTLLAGADPLDEADVARVIQRLPPVGREFVRLPWTTPQPVPEGLRAIANRTTASQERQRYHSARTLLRALENWIEVETHEGGDPIALLLDRLGSVGHLPALSGLATRIARLAASQNERTDEIAELLLQDIALSLELLRTVNSAKVRGTQVSGNGPVLTLRRAIALIGVDGVRKAAASLRAWPGPLDEAGAHAMRRCFSEVRLAGHTAQALRPAGYDAEVVYLVAVLQNLGRMLVQYHFPEECEQIRQLMKPAAPPNAPPGTPELPGMTEEAASYAVLGVDIDALGAAVARHWGLGEEMLHMIRRVATNKPVRTPDSDADMLRAAASAANEAVDAIARLPAPKVGPALQQVAQRYARVLHLDLRDVHAALQGARASLQTGTAAAAMTRPQGDPSDSLPPTLGRDPARSAPPAAADGERRTGT